MNQQFPKHTFKYLSEGLQAYYTKFSNGVEAELFLGEPEESKATIFYIQEFEYGRPQLLLEKIHHAGFPNPPRHLWELIDHFPNPEAYLSEQLKAWYREKRAGYERRRK